MEKVTNNFEVNWEQRWNLQNSRNSTC